MGGPSGGGGGGGGDGGGSPGDDDSGKKKNGLLQGWDERAAYDPEFPIKVLMEQVRAASRRQEGVELQT